MSEKTNYIDDHVLIRMPHDREYQFAAMSIVQSFVENYDSKMQANNVLPAQNISFRLRYALDMPQDDFNFFERVGLELKQAPERISKVDMELDFTEDRVMQFFAFDRHVCQIYGGMSGVQVNPAPRIRRVKPARVPFVLYADSAPDALVENIMDEQYSCVVGARSWKTYCTAAMGLPTVEVIVDQRQISWMSKWYSPVYRVIEQQHLRSLLPQTLVDLAEVVDEIRKREEFEAQKRKAAEVAA